MRLPGENTEEREGCGWAPRLARAAAEWRSWITRNNPPVNPIARPASNISKLGMTLPSLTTKSWTPLRLPRNSPKPPNTVRNSLNSIFLQLVVHWPADSSERTVLEVPSTNAPARQGATVSSSPAVSRLPASAYPTELAHDGQVAGSCPGSASAKKRSVLAALDAEPSAAAASGTRERHLVAPLLTGAPASRP